MFGSIAGSESMLLSFDDNFQPKTVMAEAPWVFLAFPGYHFARRANLKGFTYYTSNNIRFQDFSREA